MSQHLLCLWLGAILFMAGCESQRDRLMKEKYPTYPDHFKRAIDHSYAVRGMDQEQVYLAFGEPICKRTIERNGKPVEVWLYPPGGRDPCITAEFLVYFEKGVVSEWSKSTGIPRFADPPGRTPP